MFEDGKSFERLEDEICELLAEADATFLEPFVFFHEVGDISGGSGLLWFFFGSGVGFVEKGFGFFDVVEELLVLLVSEDGEGGFIVFDFLGIVFEELVAVAIVGEDHLPENLDEVFVEVGVFVLDGLQFLFDHL